MKKIPSLFERDWEHDRSRVLDQQVSSTEWVTAGEGIATVKIDGTPCLVREGKLYKRYDAKQGKTPPIGWEPCEDAPDPNSGHWPGWVPISVDNPPDRWYVDTWLLYDGLSDGTYELIGPKFLNNPYKLDHHYFVRHGTCHIVVDDLSFDGIKDYLSRHKIEGIVWHHPDGRMVKIKRRDFGLDWPVDDVESPLK